MAFPAHSPQTKGPILCLGVKQLVPRGDHIPTEELSSSALIPNTSWTVLDKQLLFAPHVLINRVVSIHFTSLHFIGLSLEG